MNGEFQLADDFLSLCGALISAGRLLFKYKLSNDQSSSIDPELVS